MKVRPGHTVRVHYTGKFETGEVFDSSQNLDPLEVSVGHGAVIQGFDQALVGMQVGEKKTVTIPPQEAYGEHRADLIQVVERSLFPKGVSLEIGAEFRGQHKKGYPMTFVIKEIEGNEVTVDSNHFLAGKTLVFDLELVEILEGCKGTKCSHGHSH